MEERGDGMKLKIEIDPDAPKEIILRAPAIDDEVRRIQEALERAMATPGEIALKSASGEIFIPYAEIFFFEVSDGKVYAHTKTNCYICPMGIASLAAFLPRFFCRASKSAILNVMKIRAIRRSPTGVGEVSFNGTEKNAFISRNYYKMVREIIEETRLK